jgi:site-specific DNA-cytosine methylase
VEEMIGNAVPVEVAKPLALQIKKNFKAAKPVDSK